MIDAVEHAQELKVVGILKPSESSVGAISHAIAYRPDLMTHLIQSINSSAIVREQKANEEIDVFTGLEFGEAPEFDMSSLSQEEMMAFAQMSPEELEAVMALYAGANHSTFENNLTRLGVVELDNPWTISVYPIDFNSKDKLIAIIDEYNQKHIDAGSEELEIKYTDFVGLLMSSISNVINSISYILIAFVAISLVVSSIMIGIITYISVLERTKEIGILRSIGASKRDISRVFNAETLIIGTVAGAIGVGTTVLLCIPANIIIKNITDISNVAALPVLGGLLLIAVSMVLTFIAGLIPSRIAAKKDPVVALRTE
jgi:putative ABC transport system permease protein